MSLKCRCWPRRETYTFDPTGEEFHLGTREVCPTFGPGFFRRLWK